MIRAALLRHGESVANAHTGTEALSDETGDRLTALGASQAQAAAGALRGRGYTRLLSSPLRRATETAGALEAALGLEAEVLPHTQELAGGESFEDVVARVRLLKEEFEAMPPEERPLLVSHGIFIRFFLLDSVLAEGFEPWMAGRIWHLRSHNCGLSEFEPAGALDPFGGETPGWTCLSWMGREWDPPPRS